MAAGAAAALDNVRIVLVRPRGAANVGAVARAMKNMGLRDLRLVRPRARAGARAAEIMAVHARDVLDRARVSRSLPEAVADCPLVVGTTCRGGLYRAAAEPPEAVAPEIVERAATQPVAVVFGPEDHGLTNDDLRHCPRLIAIDADRAYPSLNLAQAVLLCCHEIRRAARAEQDPARRPALATAAETDFLLARLQTSLLRIGFLNRQNPEHIMFAIRRLIGRAGLEEAEVKILLGLARQIEWYARDGWRRDAPWEER